MIDQPLNPNGDKRRLCFMIALLIDFATDLIRAGAGGLYRATESRRRPTRDVPMLEIDFMNSGAMSIEP